MLINIDWLSISLPYVNLFLVSQDGSFQSQVQTADKRIRKIAKFILSFEDLEQGKGRAPFKSSLHSKRGGFTYFYGGGYQYSLLEITGQGCESLRKHDSLTNVLKDWADRLTRIDIACDMHTDTDPAEFAVLRDQNRFKSGADMLSDTGRTVYVGSRKSDRYARVYRYNPPHPRAHLLRCEMVLKDDAAKMAGAAILDSGLDAVAQKVGEVFNWQHPAWNTAANASDVELSAGRVTHMANTERWLLTQVLPAIERLAQTGESEVLRYFADQVMMIANDLELKEQ